MKAGFGLSTWNVYSLLAILWKINSFKPLLLFLLQDRKGTKINQKVKTRKQMKECWQLEKGKILSQQWGKPRKNFTVCAAESSDSRIGSSRVSGTRVKGKWGWKSWEPDPQLSPPQPSEDFLSRVGVWKFILGRVLQQGFQTWWRMCLWGFEGLHADDGDALKGGGWGRTRTM